MTIAWNSNYGETMPFSDTCIQLTLAADTEQTWTIPGNPTQQYSALFEYASNSNVFVCNNATPVIPISGASGTQMYNEYKPHKRYVKGGDVLHVISPDTITYMGISLRQIQG